MQELLHGLLALLIYFIVAAGLALTCRVLIRIPDELFRKILHCILLGSLIVFVSCFQIWWHAACSAVVFAIVAVQAITCNTILPRTVFTVIIAVKRFRRARMMNPLWFSLA
jgi:hypothetical protein